MSLEVVKPGLLATLQDMGRSGFAHLGIGRAGAFDVPALRIANALCGNPPDACALEFTLLGPTLRARTDVWVALAGANCAFTVDGVARPAWAPVRVPASATIAIGPARDGCRGYLAVRGGIDVAPVLGSRSADVNARLGPRDGRPLQAGDRLPVAASTGEVRPSAGHRTAWRIDPRPWFIHDAKQPLRLLPGTHAARLASDSFAALFAQTFTVREDSNRVGLRLSGPALEWDAPIEMISEGCVPGVLQLPPSGQPIAFGPECPVSGGYPRIGQIAAVDLPRLAQLRPGDALRFAACTLTAARQALQRRGRALRQLETNIAARLRA
ncbi:MAG TPA: biotin-dependent carboxyltransferase family protein [Rhodanobacteraceae bacterium]